MSNEPFFKILVNVFSKSYKFVLWQIVNWPKWRLHFFLKINGVVVWSMLNVTTLALNSWLKQGLARVRAKKEARESHLMLSGMQKNVKEWTLTLPSELPFWEFESQMDSQIFRGQLQGSKFIGLRRYLYHWKAFGTYMFKMGSHDPFGSLKHKLWPKERSGVKLIIWLLTTKSWESPRFPCVQVTCHIRWKALDKGYNFALDLISIGGLQTKLWAPKAAKVPTLGISELPLGSPRKNVIWMLVLWPGTKFTIKGKVVACPNPGRGESYEFVFAHGLS
jgi:hypothetical protein